MIRFIQLLFLIVFFNASTLIGQFKSSVWCFGDSALIDFSDTANIITGQSSIKARGSAASISDSLGHLIFYAGGDDDIYTMLGPPNKNGEIFNRFHNRMPNGDSIIMQLWYYEEVIIPYPGNPDWFFVFSIGVTGSYGIYYSVIDMTLDSGRGAVTLKNVQLQSFPMNDGLTAIKHGNGRDWWVLFRDGYANGTYNNNFYSYLITPAGITNYNIQSVGTLRRSNTLRMKFNMAGNKLINIDAEGLIELYDFDRCTGIISNPVNIQSQVTPAPYYWSCEFSPNGNLLYVCANPLSTYLFQYDLTSPNIAATKDTLWVTSYPLYCGGQLKLAPDNKIYLSSIYYNGLMFPYPYPDSVYNMYNMYLGVINSPDSLDTACNFQPYSFYLGGKRTYLGLPNNPDYEMKPLYGSACDSLSAGIESIVPNNGEMFVTYVSSWQKAFINAQHLKGTTYTLTVTDIMGRQVFKETGGLRPPYFTKDLDCSGFSSAMYIITLTTDKERVSQKFIRQ